MILRLAMYSAKVDTIGLVKMTHTTYFIAQVNFKQYCMVIEHVNTIVLIRKKIKEKNTDILKNFYISYIAMYIDHLHLAT